MQRAARRAILGESRGVRAVLPFLGPAFIASIAYVDPGNFATNITGGARFGYMLLWVVLLANLVAMLVQSLAAKLGIATGMNLAEVCRARCAPWLCYAFWITQEITAMATDLAEFLGAAIGINLLFGIPLLDAAFLTGVGVFLILMLQGNGFRGLEAFIAGCAVVIALCYLAETVMARPEWGQIFYHSVVPQLGGHEALLLTVGIIGATVMPHVIYLHSALMQDRVIPDDEEEARRVFAFAKIDVVIAMAIAGLINMAMLFMAAKVFHFSGHADVADINTAYRTLTPLLGSTAAVVFGISLVTSGIASSHVGTMAGQVVMQGFINFRIPVGLRRIATMLPALIALYFKFDPTLTLVISQVVLSFTLPIPIITLVLFTSDPYIMGKLANGALTRLLAVLSTAVILSLNVVLLYETLVG